MSASRAEPAPALDEGLLGRLRAILGDDGVRTSPAYRLAYATDGMPTAPRHPPAVLRPARPKQIPQVLRLLSGAGIPFVARGAGTGLSAGAVPLDGAVVVSLAGMRRVLHLDPARRVAVVEPGVVNAELSRQAAPFGLTFAPDPSSESACTIGGNVAENAGGPHTLKHGVTRPHVLALESVLFDGTTIVTPGGGRALEDLLPFPPQNLPEPDLLSLLSGSEGTLAVVTKIAVRLTPIPPALATLSSYFADGGDAVDSVTDLLASGFLPAAVEMIDATGLRLVDEAFGLGVPAGAKAFLLVEVDGLEEEVEAEARRVEEVFRARRAVEFHRAESESEREHLWKARKKALGAMGRGSPNVYVHDGVVPRSRLGEVLKEIHRMADARGLATANIFHAGDGNLHPCILYDAQDPEQHPRAQALGAEILELCISVGGTLTGEHGIGWEKRDLMPRLFTETQLGLMGGVRRRFNPRELLNPGKILPFPAGCFEGGGGARGEPIARAATLPDIELPGKATLHGPADASAVRRVIAAAGVSCAGGPEGSTVVRPQSEDNVERVLNLALARGWTVSPRGGSPTQDDPPITGTPRVDLHLDMTGLSKIHAVSTGDLTVEVGAGISLKELNDALAPDGLWVPLDAEDDARSTLGGILATGTTGSREGRWGAGRFRVLAVEVCSPGLGRQLWGRGVTKNVAGYDIARTAVGSRGALGIATRFVLRSDPRPRRLRTAVVTGSLQKLCTLSNRLFQSPLPWSRLDLVAPLSGAPAPASFLSEGRALLVGCDGTEQESLRLERELGRIVDGDGGIEVTWRPTDDIEPVISSWFCSEGLDAESGGVFRAHIDPLAGREMVPVLAEQLAGHRVSLKLHVRTGVLRIAGPDAMSWGGVLVDRLREGGAWTVAERCPSELWDELARRADPVVAVPSGTSTKKGEDRIIADLASIFDPSGLIVPAWNPLVMAPERAGS